MMQRRLRRGTDKHSATALVAVWRLNRQADQNHAQQTCDCEVTDCHVSVHSSTILPLVHRCNAHGRSLCRLKPGHIVALIEELLRALVHVGFLLGLPKGSCTLQAPTHAGQIVRYVKGRFCLVLAQLFQGACESAARAKGFPAPRARLCNERLGRYRSGRTSQETLIDR